MVLMRQDQSADGRFIASGHENGSVYIFSTESGRMPFSLSGKYFVMPASLKTGVKSGWPPNLHFQRPG